MTISIRKAEPHDAEQLQKVYYESWLVAYPNKEIGITREDIEKHFEGAFTKEGITAFAERIHNMPSGKVFLVAVDEDTKKVVGLCRLSLQEKMNQLQAIYILPEYQRQGIGHMLWQEAVKFFDHHKNTLVNVATYNAQAISFYKKLGFIDTGKRFEEERHRMPISRIAIPEMEMMLKK